MKRWLKRLWNLLFTISEDNSQDSNAKKYPELFYRGVQNDNDVDENGYLKSSAFLFGSSYRESDDMGELSIVWNDCEDSLVILRNQKNKKKADFQFKIGYATVQLSRFTNTVITQLNDGLVNYERRPIEGDISLGIEANPYHGNILIHKSASDQMKKNIQHSLATIAKFSKW